MGSVPTFSFSRRIQGQYSETGHGLAPDQLLPTRHPSHQKLQAYTCITSVNFAIRAAQGAHVKSGHDRFLPYSFKFIIRYSSHSTAYNLSHWQRPFKYITPLMRLLCRHRNVWWTLVAEKPKRPSSFQRGNRRPPQSRATQTRPHPHVPPSLTLPDCSNGALSHRPRRRQQSSTRWHAGCGSADKRIKLQTSWKWICRGPSTNPG